MPMRVTLVACGMMIAAGATPALASGYWPSGPQTDVPISTVLNGGWSVCHTSDIGAPFGLDAATTLAPCSGNLIMLAGHLKGSDSYAVLAAASKSAALTDTGYGTSNTHEVHGSQWYNSGSWAFGFAPQGETVDLSSCDVTEGEQRMCVHTFSAIGGFRVGNHLNLNTDTNWEVVVLTSSTADQ